MTFAFSAIGTHWVIETEARLEDELRRRILERIERFDATYSRFRPDSLISDVAGAARGGRFEFPADSIALFDLYDRLAAATAGAVDPLVGRDLELLGYDAGYSLTPAPRLAGPHRSSWSQDLERDGSTVVTRRPLVIDVGAAGKGYLVDLIARLLRSWNIKRFVVDGSGDILHAGDAAIRIGLEHPLDPSRVIGVAELQNAALCESATEPARVGGRRRALRLMRHAHSTACPPGGSPGTPLTGPRWIVRLRA